MSSPFYVVLRFFLLSSLREYKKIAIVSSMHASTNLAEDILTIGHNPNNFKQLKLWSLPRIYEQTSQ
ncbi:hypothetical protein ERO13_A04G118680v2 [Gossypium hirsutum]|nr:hypothetical protein ERO13_A04G118680v2 [Gossypium hirsutum]